ncbi:MAG: insulinase family protein [Herpetosiphonaceae bacterium]|nr:insulinase family protein [Herpetosiphonaceae bacterium]
MPHLRSASWTLLIPAGSATDPSGRSGAAQVLNGMIYRGAGDRDARALSDAVDDLGVQRGGGVDREYMTLSGALLADDLPAALALYADIVQRPQLPVDELDAERALAVQAVQSLQDRPAQRLFQELNRIYFPGNFGRPTLGEIDELGALTPGDLQADHQARFCSDGAILAVAGGVEFEAVKATVEQLFGNWAGKGPSTPAVKLRDEPLYHHLPQDTAQTQIGVAYAGFPLGDPEYYMARLALNVLSGGMGARLFTEVREKRGLVYSVGASPRVLKGVGMVLGYAGTQPERAQETVDVLLGELRRIKAGVSADELERARTGLLAALVMAGEATGSRAGSMAADIFLLGRPRTLDEIRDAVEGVTLAALNEHVSTHAPTNFTVLTLGPAPVEIHSI